MFQKECMFNKYESKNSIMSKSWISKPWAAGQIKPPITGKYLPASALNEHVLNQNFVQVSSIRPVYTAYSKKNNSMFSKA